jgi:hypothetical protein
MTLRTWLRTKKAQKKDAQKLARMTRDLELKELATKIYKMMDEKKFDDDGLFKFMKANTRSGDEFDKLITHVHHILDLQSQALDKEIEELTALVAKRKREAVMNKIEEVKLKEPSDEDLEGLM